MAGVAIITEACIGEQDRACVDVCPVHDIYEFDPVANVLLSAFEVGSGEIASSPRSSHLSPAELLPTDKSQSPSGRDIGTTRRAIPDADPKAVSPSARTKFMADLHDRPPKRERR